MAEGMTTALMSTGRRHRGWIAIGFVAALIVVLATIHGWSTSWKLPVSDRPATPEYSTSCECSPCPGGTIVADSRKKVAIVSGYDQRASEIFRNRYSSLRATSQSHTKIQFHLAPQTALVHGTNNFWRSGADGQWEPRTYQAFNYYIDGSTTFVDFGTWVGVTLLYGAQLAGRAFGLEADPAAYAECLYNLRLNSDAPWYRQTRLLSAGVGTSNGVVEMHSKDPGNSMSSAWHVAHETPNERLTSWNVMTYTLPWLFEAWGVNPETEHVFVKVDVESFECKLVPSWVKWLKSLQRKPTFYLSLHSGSIVSCSPEEYAAFVEVANAYTYVTEGVLDATKTKMLITNGEIVLSDVQIPPF